MKSQQIPNTDSIKELAQFWDSHDLTDHEDQLVEVSEQVFKRKEQAEVISIHLAPGEAEAVKRLATSRGVSADNLIHDWVVQQLK